MKLIPVMLAMAMHSVHEDSPHRPVQRAAMQQQQIPTELLSKNETKLHDFISNIDHIFNSTESKALRHVQLKTLFDRTKLSKEDLSRYLFWDFSLPYSRNRIAMDGKHYELLALCWNPGRESRIHNHPGDGCFVKIISGSVRETVYDVPNEAAPTFQSESILLPGSVCYMDDSLGLHRLGNPSKTEGAVTLHLYTPPVARCKVSSVERCNIGRNRSPDCLERCFENEQHWWSEVLSHCDNKLVYDTAVL